MATIGNINFNNIDETIAPYVQSTKQYWSSGDLLNNGTISADEAKTVIEGKKYNKLSLSGLGINWGGAVLNINGTNTQPITTTPELLQAIQAASVTSSNLSSTVKLRNSVFANKYYALLDRVNKLTTRINNYEPNVNVTFNPNGGTVYPKIQTVKKNTNITLPTPTKIGYNFDGWQDNIHKNIYWIGEKYKVTQNIIFTAIWEGIAIDIAFYDYRGYKLSKYEDYYEYHGKTITIPEYPASLVPEYKYFSYWLMVITDEKYEPGDKYIVNIDERIGGIIQFKPQFENAISYYAYYDGNIRISPDPIGVTAGEKITLAPASEAEYLIPENTKFAGWKVTNKHTNESVIYAAGSSFIAKQFGYFVDYEITPTYTEDLSYTYVEPTKYTIKFIADNKVIKTITGPTGTKVTEPDAPYKLGYGFVYWSTSSKSGIPTIVIEKIGTEDVTYYAIYDIRDVYISWDEFDTIIGDAPNYAMEGDYITMPSASKKSTATKNYNFIGWKPSFSSTIYKAGEKVQVWGDTCFEAQWSIETVKNYKVTFMDGINVISTTEGPEGTTIIIPKNPTKTGYTFLGWSTKVNGAPVGIPKTLSANATYYTVWVANTYNVTLNGNGGLVQGQKTLIIPVSHGSSMSLPNNLIRDGYTLLGWATTSSATKPNVANNVTITKDIQYYAVWEEIIVYTYVEPEYTITFMDGNSVIKTTTGIVGTPVSNPDIPIKPGYKFVGWNTNKNATSAIIPAAFIQSYNLTYYAIWRIYRYTVTFDVNGGNKPSGINDYELSVIYGQGITLPTNNPTRVGYTFLGWATTNTATKPNVNNGDVPNKHVTYYAVWRINNYTVYWYGNGGLVENQKVKTVTCPYNSYISQPNKPIRDGYTFLGWADSSSATSPNVLGKQLITSNKSFYAVWDTDVVYSY